MDDLQEYDVECFPPLKSSLELDGLTLEDLLKRFSNQHCEYAFKVKQGWFEEFFYAGLAVTVLMHSKQKEFAWKDISKWVFHPNIKKLGDTDFEVWMKDNNLNTRKDD